MIHQLLNPDSNAGNFLRLTKTDSYCCGDKATVCKSSVTYPSTENLVSFEAKNLKTGENEVFPIVGNPIVSISNSLSGAGYLIDTPDSFTYMSDGTNTSLAFVGDIEILNVTTDAGAKTVVKECVPALICDYKIAFAGNAATTTVNYAGVTTTIPALVYGTNAVGDVQTAFDAAGVAGGTMSTLVTDDTANGVWVITFKDVAGKTIIHDGVQANRCNCQRDYVS